MAERMQFELAPLGDTAVEVLWKGLADQLFLPANLAAVHRFEQQAVAGVIAVVPGFSSLTIHYDPLVWSSWEDLCGSLRNALEELDLARQIQSRLVEVPVCYSADHALDLEVVAALTGLTSREIVRWHSAAEYTVRMIGFMPGFPYLAGLPPVLSVARRECPRLSVPSGSVAIGGNQAGIYPVNSPGGWQIIGRTPLRLFDPNRVHAALFQPGDRVRFRQVSPEEFLDLEREQK